MDYVEKLKKRLVHWMDHNNKHMEEYKKLAEELTSKGMREVSEHILNLVEHTERMNRDIENALKKIH